MTESPWLPTYFASLVQLLQTTPFLPDVRPRTSTSKIFSGLHPLLRKPSKTLHTRFSPGLFSSFLTPGFFLLVSVCGVSLFNISICVVKETSFVPLFLLSKFSVQPKHSPTPRKPQFYSASCFSLSFYVKHTCHPIRLPLHPHRLRSLSPLAQEYPSCSSSGVNRPDRAGRSAAVLTKVRCTRGRRCAKRDRGVGSRAGKDL